ncbi:serine O-acetyltransferase EpsC [Butyricicoccus porcorum]|uniref:Serine acetyltransferase n=1 Tax=Butyricicoccus porcorum TaxID=1945634 RepID=A0A252F330_9FIRM|nr:serine O-acetyltransferase EpsC [Butyricicoccus porcorum]MDD6986983.1 serine O-acetyltransferase [Butyricicoccus porcorum]MDY4482375.1 serine O-acetyltransferase EpsC [Butyricicoccus porcorum]OUM20139.1 serine acetyltransferase [Butyricicoccus porcorum]
MSHFNDHLDDIVRQLQTGYQSSDLFFTRDGLERPNRNAIIQILNDFRQLLFPGYFGDEKPTRTSAPYFAGHMLTRIYEELCPQIELALAYREGGRTKSITLRAEEAASELLMELPRIQKLLLIDVEAALNGDPAAGSREQVIFSYPGLNAIFVHRIAHELYLRDIPYIPRIMSEYVHGLTGIDINSGATIGEYFFIDHGTGVVIGETTTIGNNVKIYQGVTLGALSTRAGLKLAGKKRHPTIEDDVTIYSNVSILGGQTVIGKGCTIGGNAFITSSIPPFSRVSVKNPELTVDDFGEKAYEASGNQQ